MIKLHQNGAFFVNGEVFEEYSADKESARKGSISYKILQAHNSGDDVDLRLRFDCLASHDITYVGIIQTARASGLVEFPVPYVMTNCHNSLCAVGGTINEDDHVFGLSAAKKYGGIFVPPHIAVIHTYMREMMAGCGKMILGSDSHTRYGALGCLAVGEGGGELAKQLLGRTYDVKMPEVVGVLLTGAPPEYAGPMDVALAIVAAVFSKGYVKNKIMEFIGGGIDALSVEFRNGIDVMTTETTCLSSVWRTDEKVREYLRVHGREGDYARLDVDDCVYYDGFIEVDLSVVKPMIALPYHPSNAYTIDEFYADMDKILPTVDFPLKDKIVDGRLYCGQGSIVGCAGGTFENIADAADILGGESCGDGAFALSVYPGSQPVFMSLMESGVMQRLTLSGAVTRTAFCGPCFGAGDVPANNTLSLRHATRNFPNREGSKPGAGQMSAVALADAKTIAATAANKGFLTSAEHADLKFTKPAYTFNGGIYANRVYNGFQKADKSAELVFGPNIADWPEFAPLTEDIILKVVSFITDPVTTTDELIPSGETSSYRSNPVGLAEYTLSRKDPDYVRKAKAVKNRAEGITEELEAVYKIIGREFDVNEAGTAVGSVIYAIKPGDGSAREQAASCQKVLGGLANICREYATKRYRSNLINWGLIPFTVSAEPCFENGGYIFIPNIRRQILDGVTEVKAYAVGMEGLKGFGLTLPELTEDEKQILVSGCLINYYKNDVNG
jgi:aconitate hydratase